MIARWRAAGGVFAEDDADLLLSVADGPDRLDEMVARIGEYMTAPPRHAPPM